MEENKQLEPFDIFSMSDEDFLKTNTEEVKEAKTETHQETQDTKQPKVKTRDSNKEKAFFDSFQKPITVGDKEIDISDPEKALDIIYNGITSIERLRSVKPQLIACKTLSEAGFDIEKHAPYILDLLKGEPQAIEKLLYDNNIQPYTLKPFDGNVENYVPKSEMKSESTYDLNEYLMNFSLLPQGKEAINYVNSLEASSIEHVVKSPQLLDTVRTAMISGYHEEIVKRIEENRLRGFNYGINEIIHYLTLVDQVEELGLSKPKIEPKLEEEIDNRVNDGRKNAGIQSNANVQKYEEMLDWLSMSDEEFISKMKSR